MVHAQPGFLYYINCLSYIKFVIDFLHFSIARISISFVGYKLGKPAIDGLGNRGIHLFNNRYKSFFDVMKYNLTMCGIFPTFKIIIYLFDYDDLVKLQKE